MLRLIDVQAARGEERVSSVTRHLSVLRQSVKYINSGSTSDMRSNWVLVQPQFVKRIGATIDDSSRHRVTMADGTATNTLGVATMTIALPNVPRTVKAQVPEMTDLETFDLLVGFSFLLQENASLYNNTSLSDPPEYGVMFPGGTIVPYKCA